MHLGMLENHVSETMTIIVLGGNFIIKSKQPLTPMCFLGLIVNNSGHYY